MGLAQSTDDWNRLRNYGQSIGVARTDTTLPDSAGLAQFVTEIVYGHVPRQMQYQGVAAPLDTTRLTRLIRQFSAGADWCPLLDSLESHDQQYLRLKAYCMRCLVDDYMADALTIEQVQETLNTYRWINRFRSTTRILINIPSATLRVVDRRGHTLLTSRVILGKPDTPTPSFTAWVPSLVTYPYWHVPRSIMLRELLPVIRQAPAERLAAMKLQVIDTQGRPIDPATINWAAPLAAFPYRLRQSTGCDNALGLLKINVTSPYAIYLHDTNARHLFRQANRFLSHGCVRVEKPAELANLLLGRPHFRPDYLTRCAVRATPQTIQFPAPVPVLVTYSVLDIDEAGAIQVYRDVYGRMGSAL
ncbi:hypothetical protein GCM10027578_42170 [Spirosoma luteolum]